jgi:hypothetical protein
MELSSKFVDSLNGFFTLRSNENDSGRCNRTAAISKCVNNLNESNSCLEERLREIIDELKKSVSNIDEEKGMDLICLLECAERSLQTCFLLTLTSLLMMSASSRLQSSTTVDLWMIHFMYTPLRVEDLCHEQMNSLASIDNKLIILLRAEHEDEVGGVAEETLSDIKYELLNVIFGTSTSEIYPSSYENFDSGPNDTLILVHASFSIELLRSTKNLLRLCNLLNGNCTLNKPIRSTDWCKKLRTLPMMQIYLYIFHEPLAICLLSREDRDKFSREACNVLLHALRGADSADIDSFIAKSKLIPYLKRNLLRHQPVVNIISIIRIIHVLAGRVPNLLKTFDNDWTLEGFSDKKVYNGIDLSLKVALIATIAWCVRSQTPPFPGSCTDRRPELLEEILHTLFAMSRSSATNSQEEEDAMTQLGILLCEIIRLPNADMRVYQCKLAAVKLLMEAPPSYTHYLLLNGGIPPLVTILMLQATSLVVEQNRSNSTEDAFIILPILAVLLKVCQSSPAAKDIVKLKVFPVDTNDSKNVTSRDIESDRTDRSVRMEAEDAPKGTLRWKLIKLMTWTDTNVKRCASELLWTLCNEDPDEFIRKTGLGNSIHMLSIKGLLNLPKNP